MTQQEFIEKWTGIIHQFDIDELIKDVESIKTKPDPINEFWVARDCNGDLWHYQDKPKRGKYYWKMDETSNELPKTMFPNLKWEDEPVRVRLEVIE